MNQSYKRFLNKLQQSMLQLGIEPGKHAILVACSGGVDSTVLVHALHAGGYKIQVAHVNYKLRKTESDENQLFVTGICSALKIPVHVTSFNTEDLLTKNNSNLQELARNLRYNWFYELIEQNQMDYIATAHHADDQTETMIHHFLRGCGLKGLSGIAIKNHKIIRPFLSFNKEEILSISHTQQWSFSKDSSNEKNDYTRNFIRNKVIPLIREINPGITETLRNHADLYREMNAFIQWSAQKHLHDLKTTENEHFTDLNINALKKIPGYPTIMFEFLRPAGFNHDQIQQICLAIAANKIGFLLKSETHMILVDRNILKLSGAGGYESDFQRIHWDTHSESLTLPDGKIVRKSSAEPDDVMSGNGIKLDIQLQTETLYFRHWKKGDIFHPLGMNGKRKKVSDYFIDSKLNRFEKSQVWLLVNEKDEIIWIAGMRADHRFIPQTESASFWIFIE